VALVVALQALADKQVVAGVEVAGVEALLEEEEEEEAQ
jgi:hypothetical protein